MRVKQDGRCHVAAHSPAGSAIYLPLPHTIPTEQALASAPPAIRVQAAANYHAAQQAITKGFYATVFKKDATTWRQWRHFCSWMKISPDQKDIEYPIPFLHIFSEHVCAGLLSAQGQPIKKRYVKEYLRSISKIFVSVGANDPHFNRMGELDFWLGRQLASYQKEYYPPTRVRTFPARVI